MVGTNPPLQVVGFVGSRRGDAERGPAIRLRSDDARMRGIADGDLVWIYGPRRHDLAPAIIDDTLPRGGVVVRDVAGLAPTEIVRLLRVDDERPLLNPPPV
ncbi:MAG: molybdopterin dinucleotide binding domain-containing protein [Gemmatimonadota bacterium]|mgnify:CR=1 FL=1